MRKKYMSLIIVIIFIGILGTIGCYKNFNSNKTIEKNTNNQVVQNADDSEALYESTLVEVQNINDNSDMLGAVLLSEPDEGMPMESSKNLPLDDEGNKGEYSKGIYHGEATITQIELVSPDTNVLGIHVGDDKQVIADKLKDTAYEQSDPIPYYQIVYRAYHVSLSFELSEEDKIVSILIFVCDPTEEIPTF